MIERFNKLFFPHDNKVNHFKALDGLRGIAVLIVLLSHSSNVNVFFHEHLNFQRIGKVGVYLFFVLSAYLLDRQIALVLINKKSSLNYWKNYFLRRFLRIYPLFLIALLLHIFLSLIGYNVLVDDVIDIPAHIFLLRGDSVFWSIPVEFKYYFISPLIMWFCHKFLKWDKFKLLITFFGIIISSMIIQKYFHLSMISTFRFFPVFIIGTVISIYELLYKDNIFKNTRKGLFDIVGFISLGCILLTIPYYFKIIFGFEKNFHSPYFYLPYAVLWGIVLLSSKYGTKLIRSIFEIKILRFIGSISFSIYLFHMQVLKLVCIINIPSNLKIYAFFLLTIILSSFSYLLIERPLSKIRIKSKKE